MGRLKSIRTPERALIEIKKCIKEGRDLIGRGEWTNLMVLVNDIKELLDFVDNWSSVITHDKLPYHKEITNVLLEITREVKEQIMFTYPEKNFYGFPLAIDSETRKKRGIGNTWQLFEEAFNMTSQYGKIDEDEHLGIYDKYGDEDTVQKLPQDLIDKTVKKNKKQAKIDGKNTG